MLSHYLKPLAISLPYMLAADTALRKAAYEQASVLYFLLLRPFYCRKHPIIVRGDGVGCIIVRTKFTSHQKGLMTYRHAPMKAPPCQLLRQRQTPPAQRDTLGRQNHSIPIVNILQLIGGRHHLLQGLRLVKQIPCIHKQDIFPTCQVQTLVHGEIQALVPLADPTGDDIAVSFNQLPCAIARTAIYNHILHSPVRLFPYACHRLLQIRRRIVTHRYHRHNSLSLITFVHHLFQSTSSNVHNTFPPNTPLQPSVSQRWKTFQTNPYPQTKSSLFQSQPRYPPSEQ